MRSYVPALVFFSLRDRFSEGGGVDWETLTQPGFLKKERSLWPVLLRLGRLSPARPWLALALGRGRACAGVRLLIRRRRVRVRDARRGTRKYATGDVRGKGKAFAIRPENSPTNGVTDTCGSGVPVTAPDRLRTSPDAGSLSPARRGEARGSHCFHRMLSQSKQLPIRPSKQD
ncbi:hypothetical protein ANANG_G00279930 [Anguilla anguilla]|uniref:Uncharacterized protein n=1 Tax=Anguilla anguilla TaxID=7936 RepID=A0A9D3LNE3_ANGAN|nr:hypothetical protein ANANG_G00279930 [Anguilla anguilla]